jgi:hypothetical protein
MFRHRSKLVYVAVIMVLLTMSAALWPLRGASANVPSLLAAPTPTPTSATCPNHGNNACFTNTPTVGLTLSGSDQTVSFILAFTLASTFSSWHVSITATQFTAGSHTLPTTALSVTAVSIVPTCSGSSCPINGIGYPVNLVAGTPATFYNNTGGGTHGQGTFTIQATIQVAVPAKTYIGTYTSTITIAFISG